MPLGIGFLIFLARNPELSRKLGLISAKANLMAYSATNWPTYLGLFAEIIAAGGFFFFVLAISWVFGREFADGTLKDMLAVPVQRSSILPGEIHRSARLVCCPNNNDSHRRPDRGRDHPTPGVLIQCDPPW